MTKNTEELTIFIERTMHLLNLWTVYNDMLSQQYIPSMGSRDHTMYDPRTTMMLILYAYFYSLIEDSDDGLNAFRIWREHFPEEDQAISAVEAQIAPFTRDLRLFRNRLGFHGSRSRSHEAKGFDLFANSTGTALWNALKNFKALASSLLARDMALKKSNDADADKYRKWIDAIAARAKQQAEE
ncbi:MAG TPA: hypothetical protein VGQ49_00650 [Bryobacteraceae bacterium]|jgi:hypothetical protein|nr:hypothetical protein [Bryobacteraceae bacterium]